MGFFDIFKNERPPILEMDEVYIDEKISFDFKNKYYIPRLPIIIKGGAANWLLMQNWTKEYLIKNAGDYMCTVISDSRPAVAKEQTSLKDYFKNYSGKSTLTLDRYKPSNDQFFFKDIKMPNAFFENITICCFALSFAISQADSKAAASSSNKGAA